MTNPAAQEHRPPCIWNPHAVLPPETTAAEFASKRRLQTQTLCPRKEAARMAATKRLRHQLVKLCARHNQNSQSGKTKPPPMAFERWLSRSALECQLARRNNNDIDRNDGSNQLQPTKPDPILPSSGVADPGLVQDLSRILPRAAAQTVASEMAQQAQRAAQTIANMDDDNNDDNHLMTKKRKRVNHDLDDSSISHAFLSVKQACQSLEENALSATTPQRLLADTKDSLCVALTELASTTRALSNALERHCGGHDANQNGTEVSLSANRNHSSSSSLCCCCCNITLSNARRPGICDVTLVDAQDGTPRKPYLTLSMAHLQKFVQLWELHKEQTAADNERKPQPLRNTKKRPKRQRFNHNVMDVVHKQMSETERITFSHHLYTCLARYETLQGSGYQCAMPPVAFDAAADLLGLGVTLECFASPFNCRYRCYLSAFSDVEGPFGSLGNFFDDEAFFPESGSYQANPPFVPEVMEAMVDKIERILAGQSGDELKEPNKPLSFLVVVPVWQMRYLESLENSRFVCAKARVAAAEHAYCDGAQHKVVPGKGAKVPLRPSSWDTAVVVLQNEAGRRRRRVSPQQLQDTFCKALHHSKTESASTSLGEWEQRVRQSGKRNPE